ncbi:MAG: hypothetical protein R3352_05800 [Salinisphaeraceae bacterium]|nr:hypothetical protein [Salinisphaeraceae bacterium]
MASAISICSNALLMLGEEPISSFTDDASPNNLDTARLCSNLWPSVRDFTLRSHTWNCATKRVVLSPESTAPAFGFTHKFALPGDWLRNIEINNTQSQTVDHVVESGKLLMDGSTCRLRYVWRNEDPGSWDPMLVHACELAMAAKLAYPITSSTSKHQLQIQLFDQALRQARAVDGQDESPAQLGNFSLLEARY